MEDLFVRHKGRLRDLLRCGILRADVLNNYGLFNGSLGMAILFYEYSRFSKDLLYKQFADELMNEVMNIPDSLSLRFSDGLSGIGWGVTYLFWRNFVGGNIDEVLADLDKCLLSNKLSGIKDETRDLLTYIEFRYAYAKHSRKKCLLEQINSDRINYLRQKEQRTLWLKEDIERNIWKSWDY